MKLINIWQGTWAQAVYGAAVEAHGIFPYGKQVCHGRSVLIAHIQGHL